MSEKEELEPEISHRRRMSSVWLIPIVALVLASWLVWQNYASKGPLIRVTFETAEGISAGKTEVRCRSVKVGVVETVKLGGDLNLVNVMVRIDSSASELLHKDSRFWVVRPRISAQSVSGVDTLLSGAYIELEPGEAQKKGHRFKGLEEPPVTSSNVPGLRLHLYSKQTGSLTVGAPVYYHEYEVGRVERRSFDVNTEMVHFEIFIQEEFSSLVVNNSRFWNASGINISAGANGFQIQSPSLRALVAGGISFGTVDAEEEGAAAQTGGRFMLYKNETLATAAHFEPDFKMLLFFDQSVRGLSLGAPVEFRGIPFGRVADISFKYTQKERDRVPVLIEVDSSRLGHQFPNEIKGRELLEASVLRGLHAKLSTASLLTGALFIEFEFRDDLEILPMRHVAGFPVIPTTASGLDQLEAKVDQLLTKLNALPLEETLTKFGKTADEASLTLASSRTTLEDLDQTLEDLHKILDNDDTRNLTKNMNTALLELSSTIESVGPNGSVQGDLRRTLDELRAAIRSFDSLSKTINDKPNSILFGRDSSGDPIPRARK